jgi:alpha/beta superfamily hydrolase
MASILAYARAQHGRLPIVLAGFSFGTFVQSQLRAHLNDDEMDGMILVGSAVGRYDFPTVPADTLVIHGEIDDITPLADTINWARPQNLPVVIVPDTGHFFHGKLAILNTLIDLRWRPRSSSFFQ